MHTKQTRQPRHRHRAQSKRIPASHALTHPPSLGKKQNATDQNKVKQTHDFLDGDSYQIQSHEALGSELHQIEVN